MTRGTGIKSERKAGAGQEGYDRWRVAAVLVGNGLLRIANSGGGALVGFYLATLAREGEHIDAALVGTLGAVSSAAELLAAIPLGVLVDRFSPRLLLVSGAILGAGATQLFGLTRVVAIFFLSRTMEGIAAASSTSPLLAHLADVSHGDRATRGRIMSYYELSMLTGLALGTLVGGTTWQLVRTTAFSLMAVGYVLVGLLFAWGVQGRAEPQRSPHPLSGLIHAFRDRSLRALAPAWLAIAAIVGMWLAIIPYELSGPSRADQYLVGRFTPQQVGFILLGYALVFATGITAWSFVLARMDRIRILKLTMSALAVATLWLYLLNRPAAFSDGERIAFLGAAALTVMFASGFTPAALTFLADAADQGGGRGATLGVYSVLLGIGTILGAFSGGYLARWLAFDGLLLGNVAFCAVALVSLLRLAEPSPQS